jgi:hypothetical protein
MNTEDLIRDLIVEDQFNAKYTKRQRSIFCKNMYTKISKFLRFREKEILDRLNQKYIGQEEELEDTKRRLQHYRLECHRLKRNNPGYMDFIRSILNVLIIVYFYLSLYQWITKTLRTDQSQKPQQIM